MISISKNFLAIIRCKQKENHKIKKRSSYIKDSRQVLQQNLHRRNKTKRSYQTDKKS